MFIWQHVDIDPVAVQELQNLYLKSLPDNDDFFQSINLGIDTFLGMKVQKFVLIQVEPFAGGRIHTDWRPSNFGHQLALQIPLSNCEQSITSFWASNYTPPVQYTDNGHPYNYYYPDRCKKISEFCLTKPTIFRTDIPHSVSNTSPTVRKAISVRFFEDPWHLVSVS
jgi:hypothetical protein